MTTFQTNDPVALTNAENVWSKNQIWQGDYNHITGQSLNFIRPNGSTPSWIRFYRDYQKDSKANNFWAIGSDFAYDGAYYVLAYDGILDLDLIKVGFDDQTRGRFGFGGDPLDPSTQFQIHDLAKPEIKHTMSLWSQNNGIIADSRSQHCDSYTLMRGGFGSRWLAFAQGDRSWDWRIGMDPKSYEMVFFNGQGQPNSPEHPGKEMLRIKLDGTLVGNGQGLHLQQSFLDKIEALENRIVELEQALTKLIPPTKDEMSSQPERPTGLKPPTMKEVIGEITGDPAITYKLCPPTNERINE